MQRRAALASLVGAAQSFAIDCHHPGKLDAVGFGKGQHELLDDPPESFGVQSAEDAAERIVAGNSMFQLQELPSSFSLDWPNNSMSVAHFAPHSVAASAITRMSSNSCNAFGARGSGKPRKILANSCIGPPMRFGSPSKIDIAGRRNMNVKSTCDSPALSGGKERARTPQIKQRPGLGLAPASLRSGAGSGRAPDHAVVPARLRPSQCPADRSGRRSSPWSRPPQSPSRTSASSPSTHRLPRRREAASANRRSGRRRCRST